MLSNVYQACLVQLLQPHHGRSALAAGGCCLDDALGNAPKPLGVCEAMALTSAMQHAHQILRLMSGCKLVCVHHFF